MNSFFLRYKIPILLSLVSALAYIALKGESNWLNAVFAFVGAFVGALLVDSESIIYSFILDSASERSKKIKFMLKRLDLNGFADYLNEYDYSFGESSIKSVFFQLVLFVFSVYVFTTGQMVFIQVLVLSMFSNLLYAQYVEFQKTRTLERWFWLYKGKISSRFFSVYLFLTLLLVILQYTFL